MLLVKVIMKVRILACVQVIRPMFSNPPRHGAAIVVEVLSDPSLYAEWRVSTLRTNAPPSGTFF